MITNISIKPYTNEIVPVVFSSEKQKCNQVIKNSSLQGICFFIVTKGSFTLELNSHNYKLQENDGFIIFKNEIYTLFTSEENNHSITLGFDGEGLDALIADTLFTKTNRKFILPNNIFNSFLQVNPSHTNQNFFALSILYLICTYKSKRNNNNYNNNRNNSSSLVADVKKYINDNLSRDIQVSEIAEAFNISRIYLYKIFMNNLNISPKEYILNKKMRKAYTLISKNSMPIYQIAESLGYKDQFVFSKMFKKSFLLSPREVASGKVPYISVLDDENGEYIWPSVLTTERHYKGNYSLVAYPYYDEKRNCIEGWLLRSGYYGSTLLPRILDISTLTNYGRSGALTFMIFVERQNDITNWCIDDSDWIRFGSSPDWDTDFQYWTGWHKQIVKEGWNKIVLPFGRSEWGNVSGEPNYTNFKSFSIMLSIPKHCRCFIDDIKVVAQY